MMYIILGIVGFIVLIVVATVIWCIYLVKNPKALNRSNQRNDEKIGRNDEKIGRNDEIIRRNDEIIRRNDEKIKQDNEIIHLSNALDTQIKRNVFTERESQELQERMEIETEKTYQSIALAKRGTALINRETKLILSFSGQHDAEFATLEAELADIAKQQKDLYQHGDETATFLRHWIEIGRQRPDGYGKSQD